MTATVLSIISTQVFLRLLTVYLVSSAHLKLNERSATEGLFDGPKFTSNREECRMLRSLKESMADLKTRTRGLKHDAELFKDFLKEQYQISDGTAKKYLDGRNWMNITDMIIDGVAISKPNEAFKSHYHLLSVFGLYVKQLRINGTLAVKKNEDETREKLYDFETEIYSCMVSLKIALKSSGSDVTRNVKKDILDPNFMKYGSPLKHAIYRAYITMNDGINLMEFLNTIYQNAEKSIMEKTLICI